MIGDSIGEYLENYSVTFRAALKEVAWPQLERAYHCMRIADRIFVCGNGGSAAIANHLETDFSKAGVKKIHSLSSNPSLLTMIGNDFGFEFTFEKQLEYQNINHNDLFIAISSSGKSPNIVQALDYANKTGARTVGLSGFDGGALGRAQIHLHVPSPNYGIVEDAHQTLMHVLTQWYIKHG